MGYWGKIIGGMAGFAMGGPFGAAIGAALGHAADSGMAPRLPFALPAMTGSVAGQAKVAAMLGQKQQLFSIAVVVLSAKLAKCDGPVKRVEDRHVPPPIPHPRQQHPRHWPDVRTKRAKA